MHVRLKNVETDDTKEVGLGFSWTLLLFSAFFGVPLFMRQISGWGTAIVAVELTAARMGHMTHRANPEALPSILTLAAIPVVAISIFVAIKGNELTAKHLLKNGWTFADDDRVTRHAKTLWSLG